MKDTLETLRRKISGADELGSVVRSMKALSASSIQQYEQAVLALDDYYRTIQLGLRACRDNLAEWAQPQPGTQTTTGVIAFGSGQGLVGQFNDTLSDYVQEKLQTIGGPKVSWAVGETMADRLQEAGLPLAGVFDVPHSIQAVTPLVSQLLLTTGEALEKGEVTTVRLFFNQHKEGATYTPREIRFMPLDEVWLEEFRQMPWPTDQLPQPLFSPGTNLKALVQEYLFVTLYRACAESLASENASRLAAMQRAEKNIQELLEDLNQTYHQLRQKTIDEELFDVIAGAEAFIRDSEEE